ncbi:alpha-mannosidase [Tetragenococcus koreensis]|uniref:glycoside hydrolase family 38 N-terminal domain-containing protein n=1 Tax=Tetragenococcus koreensis TaxID=290335 RepID=UPI001F3CEF5A|nr:alpha-mannosidase [Tetragenococcus koreensis]MDN6640672.1 alpha-mannosidase [Tetragenococcus sp.]MDN6730859.1 alpha-mannosidase [Atopostipes suicloacalis]MDN6839627.1 alpha-mannosidase [Tetragenococcus halophilus]MCF1584396.1 alpha-mannosidase [Tetragenococcus koreensis]MCF1613945.1 alpha-mannosidase [Tetragenococcus koreensis]
MTVGYIVNQTHWDREWYFTNADALVLSDGIFSDILDELERHPEANFCLDAQSSILEEYLELYPQNIERVKKLVANNQLFIGPWYTQSDCLLVDGESLIRNAMIGVQDCNKYGAPMSVGYIPDTFGFNAQIPTILRQIGLDNVVFWRGIDFQKQVNTPYFKWKGLGEKEIIAINIPQGYGCSPNLKTTQEYVDNRLDGYLDFVNQFQEQDEILVPAGGDQQAIVRDIQDKLKKINTKSKYQYQISNFPEFLDIVRTKESLPIYEGEFRLPAYARIHRTISSVRMDIKQANYKLEQKLLKRTEPLYVLAKKYGITLSKELLIKAWKKVLASQAHDSLGGCVYDNVATDILHRYKEAAELADGIENVIMKKMARKLSLKEDQVLVINTTATARTKYYKVKILSKTKNIVFKDVADAFIISEKKYDARENILIEKPEGKFYLTEPEYFELEVMVKTTIPGLGYKVLSFEEKSDIALETFKLSEKGDCVSIYNKETSLLFNDGSITVNYQGETFNDFIKLVDCGNDGDTYDFSPLRGDFEIQLPFNFAEKKTTKHFQQLTVYGQASLPVDLEDRQNPVGSFEQISYRLTLTLSDQNSIVDGNLKVDNQILSHRMRLVFDPKIINGDVYQGLTAGYLKNNKVDFSDTENYPEYPAPISTFDKTLSLANDKRTFDFYGQELKEYEFSNDKLFITLFSSTGQLGKPDLLWRAGRASGDTTNQGHVMHPTPLAQLLGERTFGFSFDLNQGNFSEYRTQENLTKLSEQTVSYQIQDLNYFVYRLDNKIQESNEKRLNLLEDSLLDVKGLNIVSIYPSYYEEDKFIIRLTNATEDTVPINKALFSGKYPVIINALEEELTQDYLIKPYDMVTIKLSYR